MAQILVIGPMGVGKTTIGKAVAKRLNLTFVDTDHVVEKSVGKTVADIFIEDGEPFFREKEKSALAQALSTDGVVALGGGACVAEESQAAIRKSGARVIFLDISLSEVSKRIGFDKARPLLAINPRSKWQELMNVRRPIYESLADKIILVDGKKISQIVDEVVAAS